MLARTLPADSLRFIDVRDDGSRVIHAGGDETLALVAKALGVLPDHDVSLFIGVEGRHDINFLGGMSRVLHATDASVPDLYDLEHRGRIIFFPMGGANLALWASRTRCLNIPEFYIQNSDITTAGETSSHQSKVDEANRESNCTAVLTRKREMENYLHPTAITEARPEVAIQFGDYDDVPELAAQAVHEASDSENAWDDLAEEKEKKVKKVLQAKKWLNTETVARMTPERLAERDPPQEVRGWLVKMTELMDSAT